MKAYPSSWEVLILNGLIVAVPSDDQMGTWLLLFAFHRDILSIQHWR
jgi:hypothetical protein